MFYLFPFSRVPFGCSIVIYGSGEICEHYLAQLHASKFCQIACVVDRKIQQRYTHNNIIYSPVEEINDYEFDHIVIASNRFNDEICKSLISKGFDADIIVEFCTADILSGIGVNKTPENLDWDNYYNDAENASRVQIEKYIQPLLEKYKSEFEFSRVVDFACGKGRISEYFVGFSDLLYCIDINNKSIDFCKNRFSDKDNVICKLSTKNGFDVKSESISFLFSWDAMVHFDYRSIDIALSEFYRVLKKGGYVLIHHSNLAENKKINASDNWIENPHCRSNVGFGDINRLSKNHGFSIIEQFSIDWDISELDGITLIQKSV